MTREVEVRDAGHGGRDGRVEDGRAAAETRGAPPESIIAPAARAGAIESAPVGAASHPSTADQAGSSPDVVTIARRARRAARHVATAPSGARRAALEAIAARLLGDADATLAANAADAADARAAVARGEMTASLLARLVLDPAKLADMAAQVRAVAAFVDPVGEPLRRTVLDDGLTLEQVRCPLGVVAAIFEARPDAMTQIAALALKSGNAVILKPGREATRTARALLRAIHAALADCAAIPADAVALVEGRAAVDELLALDELIDLVVPRGSKALVRSVQARTRIPVLGHADGVCHVYVDAAARAETALAVVLDGKVQYPAACNATEIVLLHRDAAPRLAEPLVARLRALLPEGWCEAATPEDWRTEFGDLVLAMRVVDGLDEAVEHVNEHGSHHTDAIVTEDRDAAERFLAHVDSASVFHNASTRFADGYRYGFGAEVGISTGKLHARGPVGMEGLTTYKFQLRGAGQVVATYSGPGARRFAHERGEE